MNGNFAPPYRARQIRDLLSARNGWRAQDLIGVQRDLYSGFSKFLAGEIVAAYEKRHAHNPTLETAIALLRGWNGQMQKALPDLSGLSARAHFPSRERLARQGPGL